MKPDEDLRAALTPLRGYPVEDSLASTRHWWSDPRGAYLGFEDVIDALAAPSTPEPGGPTDDSCIRCRTSAYTCAAVANVQGGSCCDDCDHPGPDPLWAAPSTEPALDVERDRLAQRIIRDLTGFLVSAFRIDYEHARAHAEGFVLGQPDLTPEYARLAESQP